MNDHCQDCKHFKNNFCEMLDNPIYVIAKKKLTQQELQSRWNSCSNHFPAYFESKEDHPVNKPTFVEVAIICGIVITFAFIILKLEVL